MKLHGGPNLARGPEFDTHVLEIHFQFFNVVHFLTAVHRQLQIQEFGCDEFASCSCYNSVSKNQSNNFWLRL